MPKNTNRIGPYSRPIRPKKKHGVPSPKNVQKKNIQNTLAGDASTSAKKLANRRSVEVPINSSYGYCILEFCSFFAAISSFVICKDCKETVEFLREMNRGASFKIYYGMPMQE